MPASPAFLHPALILVVDDQPRNLQMLKATLAKEGFHVITAGSGEEALEVVKEQEPDCILLDVLMPGMDGFDACMHLKADAATRDIPVIFLTGETQLQSIKKGFEAGGVDYITKPFNKQELVARVTTHVELRRAQKQHTAALLERSRIINIIAQQWHKPLQRLVFLTGETRAFCGASSDRDATITTVSTEAERTASQMLASLEDFLLESMQFDEGTTGLPTSQVTSDDVKAIVAKWYVSAMRRQIDFHIHAPKTSFPVPANAFVVTQIIDPVVSNAVNATAAGGVISARLVKTDGSVVLEVEDDGPGFPTDYLARPFVPYATGGNGRTPRHTGIGLALAKRAADLASARIDLENLDHGGARVRVSFPLQRKGLHA